MDEESIFMEALQKPTAERAAYLDEACGADPALRKSIELLLRAHERAGGFLQGNAAQVATLNQPAVTERPGDQIGPYKLLQQIGEGGMGVVFMAEQTKPIERLVAVKIIKPGMDTRQVIARFEAEEQALAMMDHPNIAKVLDAGTTDSGRPYFAMELVKGVPINTYCDKHGFTPRERLDLLTAVCQAVQHAHQKGIIHRDIKPSNILVAQYDDKPVPKIIDFGVAKATSYKLTEKTMFTQFGQIVGTIEYMSPEQAQFNQLDVDTRSDVYSLGVLMYELLAGETPFDTQRLRTAAFDEMLRIIREEEPPRPSTKLSSAPTLPAIAANRHTDPKQLTSIVRGELDWIVMKALSKDRARRYDSASALAADITRHLDDEPVLAGPPSVTYRAAKFIRKHRRPVVAGVSLLAVLFVGLAVSLSLYVRAERLRIEADESRAATDAISDRLRQANVDLEDEQIKTRRAYDDLQTEQQATDRALDGERRSAYFNRIALCYNEWQLNNVPRADRLLDECPKDLRQWEWNYLKRLSNAELLTLRGFKEMVRDAVLSPDGKFVATIDLDGKVKVWDAETGEERLTFRGHTQIPSCVAFDPEGTRIVSASAVPEVGGPRGHGMQDLLRLMLRRGPSGSGEVHVWDVGTGAVLHSFGTEHRGVRSAAFSPDGTRIATSGDDKSVRLWDSETGEPLWSVENADTIGRLAFSPDGRRIAVGRLAEDKGGEVTIRDATDGKVLSVLKGHANPLVSVCYSPDGKWIASAGTDEVDEWDAGRRAERFRMRVATGMFGNVVAFTADSRRLAVACMEQKVRLWNVETGDELPPLRGHTDWVTSIAFSSQGNRLAATAGNFFPSWISAEPQVGEVKVWDVAHTQEARALPGHTAAVNAVAFDPKGRFIASAAADNTVKVWNVGDGKLVHSLQGHSKAVHCVAVSSNGRLVASGSEDKSVRVWDTASGALKRTLEGHRAGVTSVAFNPVGNQVASASSDEVVRVWNMETGEEIMTLLGDARNTARLAFSPDGKLLVRASKGSSRTNIVQGAVESSRTIPGEVRVWDVATGEKRAVLTGMRGWVPAIAFSRDGRLLAVAEEDVVKLFDVAKWQVTKTLLGEAGRIQSLAFGRNDERLAAATEKTVKIWDITSGREVLTLDGGARSVAFDADGWLLSTASGNDVKIWDGSPLRPVEPVAVVPERDSASPPLTVAPPPEPVRAALRKAKGYLKQRDLARSLLWSVDALNNDRDPERAVVHRTRIAMLLQNLAKLGENEPRLSRTAVIPKPSEGLYDWVLGPHGRRLAVKMWNVPPTPQEKEEDKRTGRTLNRYLLQVFDVQTGEPIGPQRRSTHQFMEDGLSFSADGQKIAILRFRDDDKQTVRRIQVLDVETGDAASPPFEYEQGIGDVFELTISRDGRWVAAHLDPSTLSRHMLVWDAVTGERLELDEPFNVVYYSPDGRLLLSGWNQRASKRLNTVVQLWDARTFERIGPPLDVRLIDHACFSSDGRTVAIGDGVQIKTFDVETGKPLGQPIHIGGSRSQFALGPKGRRLAVAFAKALQVWDVVASRPCTEKQTLPENARAIEFTPGGRFLVTACGGYKEASVQLWDATTGDPVSPPLACYIGWSRGIPFRLSQDGNTLLTYPTGDGRQNSKETEIASRLSVWSLRPNEDAIAHLQRVAELLSGHTIDAESGNDRALTLAEYRQRWQTLKSEKPQYFTDSAPAVPRELPPIPDPPRQSPPVRAADYLTLLRNHHVELTPPVLPIMEALTDRNERIRSAAVRELHASKLSTHIKIRLLAEALYDRPVRHAAAEALGKLGPDSAPVVPGLGEFLENVGFDEAVVWALGRIGPEAREAVPVLRKALQSEGLEVRAEAARALVRVAPNEVTYVPDLIENLDDVPQASRAAYRALERVAREVPSEVAPLLIDHMKEFPNPWGGDDVRARNWVADLLGKMGPQAHEAIPVLEHSLNRRRGISRNCRAAEAAALWRVGGDARSVVAKLVPVLKMPSRSKSRWERSPQERAAETVGEIGPDASDAVPPLRKLLQSKLPAERLMAARALWRITGESAASVQTLVALLQGAEENISKRLKSRAIEVLGEIGPAAEEAVPAILDAIEKEDAENASGSIQFTVHYRDEEDQPPDERTLLRVAGVAALKKIDHDAARKVQRESEDPTPPVK